MILRKRIKMRDEMISRLEADIKKLELEDSPAPISDTINKSLDAQMTKNNEDVSELMIDATPLSLGEVKIIDERPKNDEANERIAEAAPPSSSDDGPVF